MAIVQFTAVDGSTIWDVVLNTYGTPDEVVKLMVDNNFPDANTYPLAGRVFNFDDTLVENQNSLQTNIAPTKFSTRGGIGQEGQNNQNNQDNMIKYEKCIDTEFVSNADGTTSINMAGIIPFGARIVQIEKEIKPLRNDEFSWNPSSAIITLLNGVTVDANQTLFIIYSIIITS